jgi:hypothetical protein
VPSPVCCKTVEEYDTQKFHEWVEIMESEYREDFEVDVAVTKKTLVKSHNTVDSKQKAQ